MDFRHFLEVSGGEQKFDELRIAVIAGELDAADKTTSILMQRELVRHGDRALPKIRR